MTIFWLVGVFMGCVRESGREHGREETNGKTQGKQTWGRKGRDGTGRDGTYSAYASPARRMESAACSSDTVPWCWWRRASRPLARAARSRFGCAAAGPQGRWLWRRLARLGRGRGLRCVRRFGGLRKRRRSRRWSLGVGLGGRGPFSWSVWGFGLWG